uniref:Uncharacterized protein n=1 Tax=Myoviridae sp. ct6F13 TaxID=2827602 RepID=A0A8S5LJM5_9CAUD|nr:MAG TPA: hypothetical protein [Myoviridae sp. ct6F13]
MNSILQINFLKEFCMKDFEFVVGVAPDEETIKEFHRVLANGLIKKYGVNTMKGVIEKAREIDK